MKLNSTSNWLYGMKGCSDPPPMLLIPFFCSERVSNSTCMSPLRESDPPLSSSVIALFVASHSFKASRFISSLLADK